MGNNNGEEETVVNESIRTAHLKIPPFLWLWLQECFVGHGRETLAVVLGCILISCFMKSHQPLSSRISTAVHTRGQRESKGTVDILSCCS